MAVSKGSPAVEPPNPERSNRPLQVYEELRPPGLVSRFLTTSRHLAGLLVGGLRAHLTGLSTRRRRSPSNLLLRATSFLPGLLVRRDLRRATFAVQLRRRLELLGPTYIKLGQILSLREDLLPREVTRELRNLLDRLPALPFERFLERIGEELGRPVNEIFAWVDPEPLGSASIGQTHLATTLDGERILLKLVKPGIRETLERDTRLLRLAGRVLELPFGRFQPRRVIDEFCAYTLREADLRLEADNAETFAANFSDLPEVVFPRIYRQWSGRDLLAMEFLDGIRPDDPRTDVLDDEDRRRLIDLGAEAIVRMLYQDGFFHADLHPGNLLILPGPRCGFIDLGMVGRFDEDLKRTLLYYFYCLVMGDTDNAARFLASLAEPGPGADPKGFRRDVGDICRRWQRGASFRDFSLGQLVLESVAKGGRYRMYFPVELVLMVKALVTFEGVGNILAPGVDIAEVTRAPVQSILLERFSPLHLAQEALRAAPEVADTLLKLPLLVTEGLRLLEQTTRQPTANPFAGLRATLFGGFCLVAGAIFAAFGGPWPVWAALLALGVLLPLRPGR